jgi:nucleoside-diphosphate-sugar epimerase
MTSVELDGATVLVVGGAGFVGSNLVIKLLDQGVGRIVIVDNLLSSSAANIPVDQRVDFVYGSIADQRILNQIPETLHFVWHLACYHGNQSSIADPIADHDNNTITSLMLFEHLSKRSKPPKVVYAAAGCAVAEKTENDPIATPEDAPISLFHDSPYSISKLIGEMYGNYYFTQYGLPFVRARFQNVYGPREILGAGQWRGTPATVWRNVIPTFIWKALNNEALILDNEGKSSRDFIYVDDIVEGLIACGKKGVPGQAYNLASGMETTILDLANWIIELCKCESTLVLGRARSWDNSVRRFGATSKSSKDLGFNAQVQLPDGLVKTIEWTTNNRSHIQASIEQHQALLTRF